MRKVKYKDRMRYLDKDDNVITEEPNAGDISPQLSQSDMDKVRDLVTTRGYDEILKSLHEDVNRYDKAGDEEAVKRLMRKIAIIQKKMPK